MQAMVLEAARTPLVSQEGPDPVPGPAQIRLRVEACAVCRTDLHVVDGDLPNPKLPLIPGHEIVGIVEIVGRDVSDVRAGQRLGVPWLGHTCGHCTYCVSGQENLCDAPLFTGYTRDGGFATQVVVDAAYAFSLDGFPDPIAAAPLMCAGLIGWRSLAAAGPGRNVGIYGFGAAAHIIAQVCPLAGASGLCVHAPWGRNGAGFRPFTRGGLGRWSGPAAAGAARCRDHFCSGGRSRPSRPAGSSQGRARRMRGDSHERHSEFPLSDPLGGTSGRLGREPDSPRRARVPGNRAGGERKDQDDPLPTGSSERGSRRLARGPPPGGGGPGALTDAAAKWAAGRGTGD